MSEVDTRDGDGSIQEARKQLREARETKEGLQSLLVNEAWSAYSTFLKDQIKIRRDQIELAPPTGIDGMVIQQFTRGEVAGLRLADEFIQQQTDELTSLIDGLEAVLKGEDEDDD